MEPTDEEIEEQLAQADEQVEKGASKWSGMTYEQGVSATIQWMQGSGDPPMDED